MSNVTDTYNAVRKKWEGTFSFVDESELGAVCGALSDHIIIVNWYDRGVLEEVLGCSVSREKYADFRGFLKKNSLDDLIAGDIRCLWHVMNRDTKNEVSSKV